MRASLQTTTKPATITIGLHHRIAKFLSNGKKYRTPNERQMATT
jgi:hypothetical protein